jgi:hypothetical protein
MAQIMPRARRDSLLVTPLHDETLIYDQLHHQAICLNPPAALIWQHCDGQTTMREMIALLQQNSADSIDEQVVRLGLQQLSEHHLLEGPPRPFEETANIMRRRLMKIGMAAALLPLISLVAAPTAVQAASGPTGATGPTGPFT